jgi:hypothetical protein
MGSLLGTFVTAISTPKVYIPSLHHSLAGERVNEAPIPRFTLH